MGEKQQGALPPGLRGEHAAVAQARRQVARSPGEWPLTEGPAAGVEERQIDRTPGCPLGDAGVDPIGRGAAVAGAEKRLDLGETREPAAHEPREDRSGQELEGAVAGLAGDVLPRQAFAEAGGARVGVTFEEQAVRAPARGRGMLERHPERQVEREQLEAGDGDHPAGPAEECASTHSSTMPASAT
ncbi:MAG: hypothetical protein V3T72_16540 [Thermoanaerobaculia bacterium]